MADEESSDVPPLKTLRYVLTVVLKPVALPDDPVAQKIFLSSAMGSIETLLNVDRIGVTAVVEDGDGDLSRNQRSVETRVPTVSGTSA